MSIYDNLGSKAFTKYNNYFEMESEETKIALQDGLTIGELGVAINELKACNHTINDLEYEYDKLKLEYDIGLLKTENSPEYLEKYKAIKEREHLAQIEHEEEKAELIEIQRQLRELKANKEGLEYEIRFYFKVLFKETHTCNCKNEEGTTNEQEN